MKKLAGKPQIVPPEMKNLNQGLFKEFNWKYATPSPISAIKDQAKCGSSYAFALAGAMEAAQALESG